MRRPVRCGLGVSVAMTRPIKTDCSRILLDVHDAFCMPQRRNAILRLFQRTKFLCRYHGATPVDRLRCHGLVRVLLQLQLSPLLFRFKVLAAGKIVAVECRQWQRLPIWTLRTKSIPIVRLLFHTLGDKNSFLGCLDFAFLSDLIGSLGCRLCLRFSGRIFVQAILTHFFYPARPLVHKIWVPCTSPRARQDKQLQITRMQRLAVNQMMMGCGYPW